MAPTPCGPSNCATGCCDPTEHCQAGGLASACGNNGGTCSVCGAGQACQSGACIAAVDGGACPSGLIACSGACVNPQVDPQNCGSCNHPCTGLCSGGTCVPTPADCRGADAGVCPSGHYCDPSTGQCPVGCSANAQCPANGVCDDLNHTCVCNPGYHSCNGLCVSETASSCGPSCQTCTAPTNATPVCADETCGWTCGTGFHACGGQCASDTDAFHCGAACQSCPGAANATPACVGGACSFTCNPGFHLCGSACVSNTDVNTCGGSCTPCSMVANGVATCDGTSCGFTCNTSYHACGSMCASNTSISSCGTSCTACPTPSNGVATCDGTSCGVTCNSNYHACNLVCDSNNSVSSCGSSCTPCPQPPNTVPTCDGGACGSVCAPGFAVCGGNAMNGCLVDLNTDPQNCSACGFACDGGVPFCSNGTCSNLYWASGVQQNVPKTALNGWTRCYSGTYADLYPLSGATGVLTLCDAGTQMLLACGPVDAGNYTLLAMAPKSAVLYDCGNSTTCTFQSNDAGWYFSSSYSWGFAPGGDAVNRTSCDFDTGSQVDTNLRMCWHTNPTAGSLNTGYRCGLGTAVSNLNNNAGWVRDVYTSP